MVNLWQAICSPLSSKRVLSMMSRWFVRSCAIEMLLAITLQPAPPWQLIPSVKMGLATERTAARVARVEVLKCIVIREGCKSVG